jgi:hypothetical protein
MRVWRTGIRIFEPSHHEETGLKILTISSIAGFYDAFPPPTVCFSHLPSCFPTVLVTTVDQLYTPLATASPLACVYHTTIE